MADAVVLGARYDQDDAALAAFLRGPDVRTAMRDVGEQVATVVRAGAHVATRWHRDYPSSLRVLSSSGAGASVFVGTDHWLGHIIEWGSMKSVPYAVIRRGVRAAGLRLEETGR